ncbi:MAG: SET domain-containing protein-lysine N-methyltransferase [Myxococcota bacterium]
MKLETRRALDAQQWSDGRQADAQAAVVLRGHPDLPLEAHDTLVARYRRAADAPCRVAASPGRGQGLFADGPIPAGTRVGEYCGVLVEPREPLSPYLMTYHPYDVSLPLAIDAGDGGNHTRFINHREPPNVAPWWLLWDFQWHVVIVALCSVRAGDELFLDYGRGFLERRKAFTGTDS